MVTSCEYCGKMVIGYVLPSTCDRCRWKSKTIALISIGFLLLAFTYFTHFLLENN